MNPATAIKFSWIMLGFYLAVALFFLCTKDQEHALMFLVGSIIWVGSIFIWQKNKDDGT